MDPPKDVSYPATARLPSFTLEYLCFGSVQRQLTKFMRTNLEKPNKQKYKAVREYLSDLHPMIMEALLRKYFDVNPWTNPCGIMKEKNECLSHAKCRLVYQNADRIVKTLYFPQVTYLEIQLYNMKENVENEVIRAIGEVLSESGNRCRLRTLLLKGSRSKDSVKLMNNFCETLTRYAPCIEWLHIPVMSDKSAELVSMMGSLKKLTVEHLRKFSARGLHSLCRNSSKTLYTLEELTLPLRTNSHLIPNAKYHLMILLSKMKSLRVLHSYSSQRPAHVTALGLPYSAIKVAMICHKHALIESTLTDFRCKLVDLVVAYGSFKPLYILSTCPDLVSLTITDSESGNIDKIWLSRLFDSEDWTKLAIKLKSFSLHTFLEAFHLALNTTEGAGQIFKKLPNLKKLKLVCSCQVFVATRTIYISDILEVCPDLVELKIEADGIMINGSGALNQNLVHDNLEVFCLSVSYADSNSEKRIENLVRLMPNLRILEISSWQLGGGTTSLDDLAILSSLRHLKKLALLLEKDTYNNSYEIAEHLFKFPSLSNFLVRWHANSDDSFYVNGIRHIIRARSLGVQVKCDRRWKRGALILI